MKKNYLFIVLFLVILVPVVSAVQPTQQYNKILLNPFYVNSMTQNLNYNYNVSVITPDGISEVKTAILTLDAWINPTRTFNAWMNNVQCNTKNYTISTTYASAGRGVVTFDCTNAIIPNKNNSVTFVVTGGNIGSSTAWLDLTYMNNPVGELKLHGTEYTIGDNAKIWLQLLNNTGNPVSNGVCYTDIYTPSGTEFIERATMTNMMHDGIYYYDLVAPDVMGVYPAIALCYYTATQNPRVFTSYSLTSGVLKSGTIVNTQSLDGTYLVFTTSKNGGLTINNRVNASFNSSSFFSQCGNVSSLLLTGITIYWNGKWNTGQVNNDVFIYLYNYSSSSYILLPNIINGGLGGDTQIITNSIVLNNLTLALGLNSSNPMNIQLINSDFDEGAKDLSTDYLYASCDQLGDASFHEVMGSSEMHVVNIPNATLSLVNSYTPEYVWNYTERNLTYYPPQVDLTNYSLINSGVWNYTERNLTYYENFSEVQVDLTNYSAIWNYPVRNLTYYENFTEPQIDLTNYSRISNLTAPEVWSYFDRNLTYYPPQVDLTNYSLIADSVWGYTGNVTTSLLSQLASSIWNFVARYTHGVILN